MEFLTLSNQQRNALEALCKSHNVETIHVFGSMASGNFDAESDIDLIVKLNILDAADRGEALLSLWDSLELTLGRKVDLMTEESIQNPFLKRNIDRTKKLLYDRAGEKVFV